MFVCLFDEEMINYEQFNLFTAKLPKCLGEEVPCLTNYLKLFLTNLVTKLLDEVLINFFENIFDKIFDESLMNF